MYQHQLANVYIYIYTTTPMQNKHSIVQFDSEQTEMDADTATKIANLKFERPFQLSIDMLKLLLTYPISAELHSKLK